MYNRSRVRKATGAPSSQLRCPSPVISVYFAYRRRSLAPETRFQSEENVYDDDAVSTGATADFFSLSHVNNGSNAGSTKSYYYYGEKPVSQSVNASCRHVRSKVNKSLFYRMRGRNKSCLSLIAVLATIVAEASGLLVRPKYRLPLRRETKDVTVS
jgi:hypothetical protein